MRHVTSIGLLTGAAALLAACGSEQSGTTTEPESGQAEYRIDKASGETRMRLLTPEGEATLRSGKRVPIALPEGFSLYPGSTVITNTLVKQPRGAATMVVFEAPARPGDIIAHFKRLALKAGYAIEVEASMKETMMLSGRREGDKASFLVSTAGDADGKTGGQLVIGSGQ